MDSAQAAVVAELDRVFDESFVWWGRVYDVESGGCFYSLSGKAAAVDDQRFGPDIESLQKRVAVLEWSDLLDDAPAAFKAGVVGHLQARQDPDSGFFRDPQHVDSYTPNTRQRATGMAVGTLRRCGGEPLHPLPIDRIADNASAAEHYAFLASRAALRDWLEGLPWEEHIWTAGARLRSHIGTFWDLDGFFGDEDSPWYARLSGTYKIAAFFDMTGMAIPRRAEMAATLRAHLRDQAYQNTIVLYNTANLLNILERNGVAFEPADRLDAIRRCTAILSRLRGPDGGFVTQFDRPSPVSNGRLVGLEVVESDTDATGLAHKTRGLLIEFLTGEPFPHPHDRGSDLLDALGR